MKFIDMHCDTLMTAYIKGLDDVYDIPSAMLDVGRMKESGAMAQFFAIFMPPPGMHKMFQLDTPIEDNEYFERCLNIFDNTMKAGSGVIAPAYSGNDFTKNAKEGKMSAFLTVEDGKMIDGKLDRLKYYYDLGIRLITWNQENCFGYPNSSESEIMSKGLKDFGKEAVGYMNELGIIIDVSHLSDGGFYDVAEISKKPFVASHSNCRSVGPHLRNLTDDMIKTLAKKGGIAGINYGGEFLNEDTKLKESTVDRMCVHILHMINIGGIECVALGSDFDGIFGKFEIPSVDKVPLLFDRLSKNGLTESDIEKIAWRNAARVINDAI